MPFSWALIQRSSSLCPLPYICPHASSPELFAPLSSKLCVQVLHELPRSFFTIHDFMYILSSFFFQSVITTSLQTQSKLFCHNCVFQGRKEKSQKETSLGLRAHIHCAAHRLCPPDIMKKIKRIQAAYRKFYKVIL